MAKVGFIQTHPVYGEVKNNLDTIEKRIQENKNADLLVIPELATSGYDFRDKNDVAACAEEFGNGPTFDRITKLAKETNSILVIGYPEKAEEGFYNSCFLATPDGDIFNYRKIHLFDREKLVFLPGDKLPPVIETSIGKIGMMICFDWLFPETTRLLALYGAQLIVHPSNLVLQFCQRSMFARSVENGVYTITANRIGTEEQAGRKLTFTGASQVVDFKGNYLVSSPTDREHVGIAEVDLSLTDNKMITDFNHRFDDRRIDLYGDIAGQ